MVAQGGAPDQQAGNYSPFPGGPGDPGMADRSEALGFQPYQAGNFPGQSSAAEGMASTAQGMASTAQPTKLAKPPKGRLFVGSVLLGCLAFTTFHVWSAFFHYRTYGIIKGRTIAISPPWDGMVAFIHVKEGQRVRQGQLLVTVKNTERRQRYDQLADELKLAQATLEAESSKLKWQTGWNIHRHQRGIAEYYQAWGEVLQEKAKLSELELVFVRSTKLKAAGALSAEQLDQATFAYHGQKRKVGKLMRRLVELKKRVDLSSGMIEDGTPQLKQLVAKIHGVQAEMARVREQLKQGEIRAPTDGTIVRRFHFPGEHCSTSQPIITILEEGSLEVALYFSQNSSDLLHLGNHLSVTVDPYPDPVPCTVTRLGDRFVAAPVQIERYFQSHERLLPVYLKPKAEFFQWMALRVDGIVKLSYY